MAPPYSKLEHTQLKGEKEQRTHKNHHRLSTPHVLLTEFSTCNEAKLTGMQTAASGYIASVHSRLVMLLPSSVPPKITLSDSMLCSPADCPHVNAQ